MSTQTVEVVEVDGPNPQGWFEITLEDGTKVSTRDEIVAKEAFQNRGTEVEANISEVVKGRFTNRYLNEINGVRGKAPKRTGSPAEKAPAPAPSKDNERIARQWAYGRATELLIASDTEFTFPLKPELMSQLSEMADMLLNATRS
jgi:hypothetical protein